MGDMTCNESPQDVDAPLEIQQKIPILALFLHTAHDVYV